MEVGIERRERPSGGPWVLPRMIGWTATHCMAIGGGSLLGLAGSIVTFLVLLGQQMAFDDSSGASGSEASEWAYWVIMVVGVASLLAALMSAIGAVVALVRRRATRNHRGIAAPIGALVLSAPGVAMAIFALGAYVVYLAGG